MNEKRLMPVHHGEVLLEEFLKPMNLSQNQIALAMRVPARRINEIVHGNRRITADTALRLAHYFNMSPRFWLGLQIDYDLDIAEDEVGERLNSKDTFIYFLDVQIKPKLIIKNVHPKFDFYPLEF